MKIVFSFWTTTEDSLIKATNWLNPKYQLYSWVLATMQARKFYDNIQLVTDTKAIEIFNKLDLPFTEINTSLDELNYDKRLWAIGKIKAYQIQEEPFVHIDNDVILHRDVLRPYINNPGIKLLCQNNELGTVYREYYKPMVMALNNHKVIVNKYWGLTEVSPCMAVYMCKDMKFNQEYCNAVFDFIDSNESLLLLGEESKLGTKNLSYSVIFEQYLAGQVAAYNKTKFTELAFNSDFDSLAKRGYTHIWAGKSNYQWYLNLEKIIKTKYPSHYKIINNLIN